MYKGSAFLLKSIQPQKFYQTSQSPLILERSKLIPFLISLFLLCFLIGFGSCTNVNKDIHTTPKFAQSTEKSSKQLKPEYVLQVGDLMDIKFVDDPHLNESVRIRPDGRISLQIVDDVIAAGLTPAQLDKILTKKYSRILNKPDLSVIVREFAGQIVYVGGEVVTPRSVDLTGNMTSLQAIMNAGGFTEKAQPKSVLVISKARDNKMLIRTVDLQEVISGKALGKDVMLKPFDVIYVPKTFISKANKFVEQYLTRMIPGWLSADFSYTWINQVD